MNRIASTIAACGALTLVTAVANAQTAFSFSYSGAGISASGIFDISPLTPPVSGEYLITGLTGTRNGSPITLLPGSPNGAVQSSGSVFWDNIFYNPPTAADPYLDFNGVGFSSNGNDYAVYYDSGAYYEANQLTTVPLTSVSLSAVPEPGIYALLGSLGLTGAALLRRRRTR
jgi:hypothetical protein